MKKTVLAALALSAGLTFLPSQAMAQQQVDQDGFNLIRSFDETAIRAALEPKGYAVETRRTASGLAFFFVTIGDIKLVALPQSCNQQKTNCLGLAISARYRMPQNISQLELANRMAAFNRQFEFAKAYVSSEGVPTVTRYAISDYGITVGNLRSQFSNTALLAQAFNQQVLGNQ